MDTEDNRRLYPTGFTHKCSGEAAGGDGCEEAEKHSGSAPPETGKEEEMVPRFADCEQCSGVYDVTENDDESCTFHYGESPFSFSEKLVTNAD